MLIVKKMHEVSLDKAVSVLNQNNQENFYDRERDIRHFAARFGLDGLSPALSVMAFMDDEPVGFVLSGVREMGGEKVAWVSDNIVLPNYRESSVREVMMENVLLGFEEESVTLATLEVNAASEKAILFYQSMGFEIVDRVLMMKGTIDRSAIPPEQQEGFTVEKTVAQDARFFNEIRIVPWKNQWQNLRMDGELYIISDSYGGRVGHVIFKKSYDLGHGLSHILVHQWRIEEEHPDAEIIFDIGWNALATLANGTAPFLISLMASDWQMVERVEAASFAKKAEHVFMIKRF